MTRLAQISAAVAAAIFLTGAAGAKESPAPVSKGVQMQMNAPIAAERQSDTSKKQGKAEKKAARTQSKPSKKAVSKTAKKAESNRKKFHALVSRYAQSNDVPLPLAHAIIRIESNYRPNARGAAGEIGLMQIKPATARLMGYKGSVKGLFDPETNIKWGMKYLGKARKLGGNTTCGTILRYNAGHGAKRMNPVSAAYCAKVKRKMASL